MNAPRPLGIVYDMPMTDYLAVEACSNGAMRELARSPWHLKNRVQIVPTRAMLNGTLVHCATLEPDALEQRYIVTPDDAPRRPTKAQWSAKNPSADSRAAMEWWTEFGLRAAGREIVLAEQFDITRAQLAAIKANHYLRSVFASGRGEVSMFWIDPETGVYCKARPDWLHTTEDGAAIIVDLKATADDTPAGFSRAVARMGYHRQEAHYRNGYRVITGREVADFVFAVVSAEPPVLAVDYRLDDETQQQAREEVADLLHQYAECQRADYWPAYTPQERVIGLPAWARRSNEVEVSYAD